jgi:hypothetical protein
MSPAALPEVTTLTRDEADLSAAAIDAFTVAIGGRQELLNALLVADGSPDINKITNLLIDPRYYGWSLRRLCRMADVTIADLFAAYQKAKLIKAHLQATKVVTDELVHVVEDVMKRARPHEAPCDACHGGAQQPPCTRCQGTGIMQILPDLDRQKLALELGHLVTKGGGGITLQQNTLVAPGGHGAFGPGAIDQLQQAVGEILSPRPRRSSPVIDVQPIPPVEEPAHA